MDTIFFRATAALLLLAAVLVVPAAAGPAGNGTSDHHIAIRQAHLAWVALKTDIEMDTALAYVSTRYNTDTTRMRALYAEFQRDEGQIPQALTDTSLDKLISDMRRITRAFRDENTAQMNAGLGSWSDLSTNIRLATTNNPYTEEMKNRYWEVRMNGQLADFDSWAGSAQADLDSLLARGYDTSKAQRALDVTVAKRADLRDALDARNEERVNAASAAILTLSSEYVARAGEIGQQVPDDARLWFLLEQADRAVGKADTLSGDVLVVTLDLGAAEPALSRLKADIVTTKRLLGGGRLEAAKKNLPVLQKDLTDLAEAYRSIARSANLPPDLSRALNAMAVSLDNTADQMGGD